MEGVRKSKKIKIRDTGVNHKKKKKKQNKTRVRD